MRKYVEARAERPQEMTVDEEFCMWCARERNEVATQELNVVKSKVFSLHSIRSVIIAKLKQKRHTQKSSEMCEFKLDTAGDDVLTL